MGTVLHQVKPAYIYLIQFKKGVVQGADPHQDTFALFGTAVFILKDTAVSLFLIEGVDVVETLEGGGIIILDTICVNEFTFASGTQDSEAVTVVL